MNTEIEDRLGEIENKLNEHQSWLAGGEKYHCELGRRIQSLILFKWEVQKKLDEINEKLEELCQ